MNRLFVNVLLAVFSLLLMAGIVQWPSSYLSGHWLAFRRADVSYDVVSQRGYILFQRARTQHQPLAVGWSRGECVGDEGLASPSYVFEYFGLIDTTIRIPWDVAPTLGPSTVAESIQATGRNISIPSWLFIVLVGYPPLSTIVRRIRERQEPGRRGFDLAKN